MSAGDVFVDRDAGRRRVRARRIDAQGAQAQARFGADPRLVRGRSRTTGARLPAGARRSGRAARRSACEWLIELMRCGRASHAAARRRRSADDVRAPTARTRRPRDPVWRISGGARMRFLLQLVDRHPEWKSALAKTLRSVLRDSQRVAPVRDDTACRGEYGVPAGEAMHRVAAKVACRSRARLRPISRRSSSRCYPDRGDETMPIALAETTHRDVCGRVLRTDDDGARRSLLGGHAPRLRTTPSSCCSPQVAAIGRVRERIRRALPRVALTRSPFVALGSVRCEAYVRVARTGRPTTRPRRRRAPRARPRARALSATARARGSTARHARHLERVRRQRRASSTRSSCRARASTGSRRLARQLAARTGRAPSRGAIGRFVRAELVSDMHAQLQRCATLLRARTSICCAQDRRAHGQDWRALHHPRRRAGVRRHAGVSAGRAAARIGRAHGVRQDRCWSRATAFAPVRRRACVAIAQLRRCSLPAPSSSLHGTLATKQPAMMRGGAARRSWRPRAGGSGTSSRVRRRSWRTCRARSWRPIARQSRHRDPAVSVARSAVAWQLRCAGPASRPGDGDARRCASLSVSAPRRSTRPSPAYCCGLSALLSGGIENWAVYRARCPRRSRISRRLVHAFGARARCSARAELVRAQCRAGSAATSRSASLLGMTPVVAAFFGLPLDVRHVTLSTGTLGALRADRSAPDALGDAAFWLAVAAGSRSSAASILGVSFSLALMVAIRADRPARTVAPASLSRRAGPARRVAMGLSAAARGPRPASA